MREEATFCLFFSISSIQRRDWTLELVGFGCAAFEGHDVYLIYEVEEYDTDYFKKRGFSRCSSLGGL